MKWPFPWPKPKPDKVDLKPVLAAIDEAKTEILNRMNPAPVIAAIGAAKTEILNEIRANARREGTFEMNVQEAMAKLRDKVTRIEGVGDSIVAQNKELADLLRQNAGNPDAISAIADDLDAKATEWADATQASPSA